MANNCFGNFLETDGIARSVLLILFMTTIGCFSYTWGYYEGVHNARTGPLAARSHTLGGLMDSFNITDGSGGYHSSNDGQEAAGTGDAADDEGHEGRSLAEQAVHAADEASLWSSIQTFSNNGASMTRKYGVPDHSSEA